MKRHFACGKNLSTFSHEVNSIALRLVIDRSTLNLQYRFRLFIGANCKKIRHKTAAINKSLTWLIDPALFFQFCELGDKLDLIIKRNSIQLE